MTNEDDVLNIDPQNLFPEAARRVEILERLKSLWPAIVNPANARYSCPVALGVNFLAVSAVNEKAKSNIANMKGNIQRGLKRLGYDTGENFALKINVRESQKNLHDGKSKAVKVIESEEKLRQYMSSAPDTLPGDINSALSHLMMYLDGRKAG